MKRYGLIVFYFFVLLFTYLGLGLQFLKHLKPHWRDQAETYTTQEHQKFVEFKPILTRDQVLPVLIFKMLQDRSR